LIDRILNGQKTWDLRTMRTRARGRIALIEGGSKCIVGTAQVTDCIGPLSLEKLRANIDKHWIPVESLRQLLFRKTYAVVLADVKAFAVPIPVNVRGGSRVTLTPENVPDRFGELEDVEILPEQAKLR
jgi:hypothetical protein